MKHLCVKRILFIFAMLGLNIGLVVAQSDASPRWSCDIHAFEYEMAVYFTLENNQEAIENLSDYEVAAFYRHECRGVGEIQTSTIEGNNTITYGYIRIRSNQMEGEALTFKVYDKVNKVEKYTTQGVTFKSQELIGSHSSPLVLDIGIPFIPGDADGDGFVDLTDAQVIFEYYMGETPANFNEAAADYDGDGTIDLTDAQLVFEYYMNQ